MTEMHVTLEDIRIAARTVWAEARGEGFDGMVAVAWALKNRWLSTKGQFAKDNTLATACLRHRQFSAWNAEDANFEVMQRVGDDDPWFRLCVSAVNEALNGHTDPIKGSCHYHAESITPEWACGHISVTQVGHHLFYNDVL
jgi:N-acetylmuramoyl-L-alanine amidase